MGSASAVFLESQFAKAGVPLFFDGHRFPPFELQKVLLGLLKLLFYVHCIFDGHFLNLHLAVCVDGALGLGQSGLHCEPRRGVSFHSLNGVLILPAVSLFVPIQHLSEVNAGVQGGVDARISILQIALAHL